MHTKIMDYLDEFKKKFKNKIKPVESMTKQSLDNLTVDKFNDWFQNEYDGYGGYAGSAKGIFLRVDKLSGSMISDFIKEYVSENEVDYSVEIDFMNQVRADWQHKQREKGGHGISGDPIS